MIPLNKILTKGKALYLAYDQGLEHGPVDFNDKNVNPEYIIRIAKEGKYNAVIFQKGIAEKYNKEIKKAKVPLIIKLNGKTSLRKGEPLSTQLCTVNEAIKLGAKAVGYTIYIGSQHESVMLREFENIAREAHSKNIPVIAWIYPRGKSIEGKDANDLMIYAARVGLEIGADIVKQIKTSLGSQICRKNKNSSSWRHKKRHSNSSKADSRNNAGRMHRPCHRQKCLAVRKTLRSH